MEAIIRKSPELETGEAGGIKSLTLWSVNASTLERCEVQISYSKNHLFTVSMLNYEHST